ncbi:MAG: hypothetical protein ACXIUW_18005 [Roseinatronobacter sp.]
MAALLHQICHRKLLAAALLIAETQKMKQSVVYTRMGVVYLAAKVA